MNSEHSIFKLGAIVLLLCGAGMAQNNGLQVNVSPQAMAAAEADFNRVTELARESGYISLTEEPKIEIRGNLVGFRSQNVLFSRRLDSRTYFIHNSLYGTNPSVDVFPGSDQELQSYVSEVLDKMSIPAAEIKQISVLPVRRQSAHPDPHTGAMVKDPPRVANRSVLVSRQIKGLPVFSSRAMIHVTATRQVGFMELHWPDISQDVIAEAHSLDSLIRSGWQPRAKEGAKVEVIEAGIIHSPAIGFAMDIQPVIRVIYASLDNKVGKKPVAYFDRNGNPVPMPRQFITQPAEKPVQRVP